MQLQTCIHNCRGKQLLLSSNIAKWQWDKRETRGARLALQGQWFMVNGRTRATSSFKNWSDFMNTARCPPPRIATKAFRGALMAFSYSRASAVGVVKSSAPWKINIGMANSRPSSLGPFDQP